MNLKLISILILLCPALLLFSKERVGSDSIKRDSLSLNGTIFKLKGKLFSSEQILNKNLPRSLELALEAKTLADQIAIPTHIVNSRIVLMHCYLKMGNIIKILECLNEIEEYEFSTLTVDQRLDILLMKVISYLSLEIYEIAWETNQELLDLAKAEADSTYQAKAYYQYGNIEYYQGGFEDAIKFYKDAFELFEGKNYVDRSKCMDAICSAYSELGQEDLALKYGYQALELLPSSDTDPYAFANAQINLSRAFAEKEDLDNAFRKLELAIGIGKQHNIPITLVDAYHYLARLEHQQDSCDLAILHSDSSIVYAIQSQYPGRNLILHQLKHQILEDYGDVELAYEALKKLNEVANSFSIQREKFQVALIGKAFKQERNAKLNQLIINKYKSQQVRFLLWSGFFLLISVLAVFLAYAYYQKVTRNLILEESVSQKTAELRQVVAALQLSNQELEHFAYIASHDLKEPMRNIISFIKLLEQKIEPQLNEQTAEYFQFIHDNAKQMYKLIEDVLEYSRVDGVELQKLESVKVTSLIDDLEPILKEGLPGKKFEIDVEANIPVIQAPPHAILMILKNLIENGIKYNKEEVAKIEVSYHDVPGFHQFKIKDNGIGISQEYQDLIFQMFKRLHPRRTYTGSGIGLAICQKIINRMGGRIWLESKEGQGSSFYFTLPKARLF